MDIYTLKEACKLLGVSSQTLRRWEKKGKINCTRTDGKHRRFSKEEIANFLQCPVEELENIKVQRPKEGITNGLKEKKIEVKGLKLEVEKEKISQVLDQIRKDKDDRVKEARDDLEILKINLEKEKLEADKREKEDRELKRRQREAWLKGWVAYGKKYLDPWAEATTAERLAFQVETIPLEVKIDVRKEIVEALKDIELKEDPDRIRLSIQNIVDEIWSDYCRPTEKKNLIKSAIAGLTFPLWLDMSSNRAVKEKIISGVGKILGERVTGLEDYEEINKRGEEIKNQMIRAIEESK